MGHATSTPRSRRALLGATLGAIGAAVTQALGRPAAVLAGSDGDVVLGTENRSTPQTSILNDNQFSALTAFKGWTYGTGYGVAAESLLGNALLAETSTASGTAGVFIAPTGGTGISVTGRTKFNRSGVASVAKGKYYVDVTVAGGLGSSSAVIATIQARRPGVAVSGVRRNYPSTGKARIYLTKVASNSVSTPVGWFVAG